MSDSANGVTLRHVALPHTEEGAALELTAEEEDALKVVYRRSDTGDYCFYALYDPSADIVEPGDYIVVPLKSTYKGEKPFGAGENYTNVIGSSGDYPYEGGKEVCNRKWIAFLNKILVAKGKKPYVQNPKNCVMEPCFYTTGDDVAKRADGTDYSWDACYGSLVGGHVLPGVKLQAPSGGLVYIFPICSTHNLSGPKKYSDVDKVFYMKTRCSGCGISINYRINTEQLEP